jgi:very-short-patch-repair endonuclease
MPRINPQTTGHARTLRKSQTPAEQKLWSVLSNRQINGIKFRRQHPIGQYIVDFYCGSRRLVIEVDGGGHLDQEEYDAERTTWLERQGYHVIRFTNLEILKNLNSVIEIIREHCIP